MGFFPSTQNSALLGALSADEGLRRRSWDRLARAYRDPIYQHLRLSFRLGPEDAADATQAFLVRCLEGQVLEAYDPSRARFRTYLRLRLDRFATDRKRAEGAQRRGGDLRTEDFASVEEQLALTDPSTDPEVLFERAWTASVLSLSIEALQRFCDEKGKGLHAQAFLRYHLGDVTYEVLALELGLDVVTLTHRIAYAQRHHRRLVLDTLRELTSTEDELRDEAQRVLGVTL